MQGSSPRKRDPFRSRREEDTPLQMSVSTASLIVEKLQNKIAVDLSTNTPVDHPRSITSKKEQVLGRLAPDQWEEPYTLKGVRTVLRRVTNPSLAAELPRDEGTGLRRHNAKNLTRV